jgi:hypothetical protein
MACSAVVFQGVSPTAFDCLKAKLQQEGVGPVTQDSGQITGDGVTITYNWSSVDQTLAVTVVSKPFFISCGDITGALHDAVIACGGQG